MDGPISTNEAAGPSQRAIPIPFRTPSVGPPERVPPVSEGSRSRASVRDETDRPPDAVRNSPARDPGPDPAGPTETQAPPYYVELRSRQGEGAEQDPAWEKSPEPPPPESLTEALAAARARWVEVNREILEAGTPDPKDFPERSAPKVETSDRLHLRLALRYERLATSFADPHPTQPLIDVFI
jgi:hypothetical protein